MEQQGIGDTCTPYAPNPTANGLDHLHPLSPEDEKNAIDMELEEAKCISHKLVEDLAAIHKREWTVAKIWKGVSDEKAAAMKASEAGRHMVFIAEIRADMAARKLLVARGYTTEEKKENEVSEDEMSVRIPNNMDKELIRYWACRNTSKMALTWKKLNPIARKSTIDVSSPRLLYLHIVGFTSEETVCEYDTRFRVFNASTNRGAVYKVGAHAIVPCSSGYDAILLQAYSKDGSLDQPLGSAHIPLTASVLSGDIITLPMAEGELYDLEANNSMDKASDGDHQLVILENPCRSRIYMRVEASWVDCIKRKIEFGDFYYRVAAIGGCLLYKDPLCCEIVLR